MVLRDVVYARCIACNWTQRSHTEPSGRVSFDECYCAKCGQPLIIHTKLVDRPKRGGGGAGGGGGGGSGGKKQKT